MPGAEDPRSPGVFLRREDTVAAQSPHQFRNSRPPATPNGCGRGGRARQAAVPDGCLRGGRARAAAHSPGEPPDRPLIHETGSAAPPDRSPIEQSGSLPQLDRPLIEETGSAAPLDRSRSERSESADQPGLPLRAKAEPAPHPARPQPEDLGTHPHPDHHLWRNGRLWWVAFTVHLPGWRKERIRCSLGTADRREARLKRDVLFRRWDSSDAGAMSVRFVPREVGR